VKKAVVFVAVLFLSVSLVAVSCRPIKTRKIHWFGDSLPLSYVTDARWSWDRLTQKIDDAGLSARNGCGLGMDRRAWSFLSTQTSAWCDWRVYYPAALATVEADVAVMWSCGWDIHDFEWPREKDTDFYHRHIGTPEVDEWLLGQYAAVSELISRGGDRPVVWFTCPKLVNPATGESRTVYSSPDGSINHTESVSAQERIDHLNTVIIPELANRLSYVSVFDAADWMDAHSILEYRPDGVHFGGSGGRELANDWLDKALLEHLDMLGI